jgi:hypothetical protein
MRHTTSDPKLNKRKYRDMIIYGTWLAFYMIKAKHIVNKGEACDIKNGSTKLKLSTTSRRFHC